MLELLYLQSMASSLQCAEKDDSSHPSFFPIYRLPSCLLNDTGPFLHPSTQVMKYH